MILPSYLSRTSRSMQIGTLCLAVFLAASGCAAPQQRALDTQREEMEDIFSKEKEQYVVPEKPVDRHYIGCAWSRQFGPVEDPAAADIRVKTERSLDKVQQDMAYSRGIALGGQAVTGPGADAALGGGTLKKARLEGVEIISAYSLADIPFEPGVPYVTEALRLANFRLKKEQSARAGISVTPPTGTGIAGSPVASGAANLGGGGQARGGTEGEGLVVAYKLHAIDPATHVRKDSGSVPLGLDRATEFPDAGLFVKARLQVVEPGAGRSLPYSLLWACPRAAAKNRDIAAAWVVEIRSTDPRKKSLTIGFPAYPAFTDCHAFGGVVSSRIDPVTDRIIRQKVQITLIDAEVTDSFQPARWDARVSVIDEAFNIRAVTAAEIERK